MRAGRGGHRSPQRPTCRRFGAGLVVGALALAVITAPAAMAAGPPTVASVSGSATVTRNGQATTVTGQGSIEGLKKKRTYHLCVPFFQMSVEHSYEIKDDAGKVIDSFKYTVPTENGKVETVTTDKGRKIKITTDHTGGVNGSPSMGCFDYKAPK